MGADSGKRKVIPLSLVLRSLKYIVVWKGGGGKGMGGVEKGKDEDSGNTSAIYG